MKNIRNNLIIFFLVALISTVDIFNTGNGFVQLALVLLASIVIFNMSAVKFKHKRLIFTILFIANVAVLALTFTQRIYLLNMLCLSYVVWSIITPKLHRFKLLFPITFLLSFISVYAAALLDFSLPIFIISFYPVYVFGSMLDGKNIIKSKKIWSFAFLNLAISALGLAIFLFKSLGRSIIDSALLLNFVKLGSVTAVYLPFITLFIIWFVISANTIFRMLISRFINGSSAFDLTDYIKPVIDLISFFAVTGITTFICEFSIRRDFKETVKDVLDPNLLFNMLVLCGIYLCLMALIGKGIPKIIIGILTIFLTVANYIKFTYFDEPFYPWDLYLVRNLIGISREYLNIPIIIGVVAAIAFLVFLVIRFRKAIGKYLKPRFTLFLLPFAAALFLLNSVILTNTPLSVQLGIQKSWYIGKDEIMANGMFAQNYFYLTELDKYLNPKPQGYNENKMAEINSKYGKTGESVAASAVVSKEKPNVIVIMSESFWDITKLNDVKFSKDITEYTRKYHKGQIAAPIIGGGTANTEFEALTGMSISSLSPGIIVYNAYLRTETSSIASVFKDNGYSTTAIHPNYGWFYNRDKVYNYFGFDNFYDVDSFSLSTQCKGPYISDYALVDKIVDTLNNSNKPAFVFGVSMQNHDPYIDKYSSHDVTVESTKLDSEQKNIVGNFAQGIYDADQSFGKLIQELGKINKPTLVYFFGDHAPRLGSLNDYYKVYDLLGTDDRSAQNQGLEKLKYYTTPFAAWSNYKDIDSFSEIVSPSHLAYKILKDTGIKYPNYFNILSELEKSFPVLHQQTINTVDNNNDLIKDYRLIQYDLLFGKKYLY
ncbi:LTA synthase family protein [Ruminiclostridium cellulolyticum]|uniref:Sulfatase n=1 Tax=Ruminiclostridium cellulolyticum (strain ATCC 35319 / DSM 5812 / JCM 6584 / H10) TaxID=394503 RepID=B8I1N5_RUMCH|nr:LTA synthase family protein [Ruminiclostridium cellulolyticum]ACL77670.1 sulfatase [Ruminiclostridium cellulolyticum H10]